jgi:hypothetical protein
VTWLVAARRGLVGLVEGLESVYRIHAGGLWSGGGREDQLLDELALYEALEPHFGNRAEALRLGALKCRVQLAVERCGVTHARPVALVGPRMVVPWYLNGRRVEHLTGTGADMIEEIERLRRSGAEPALPHWRSQTPAVEGDGLHVVVVEPDAQRVELRAHLAAFPCVWRDAACAIHRLPAAAPAEPLEVSAIWRAETSELVSAHLDLPKPGERTTDGGVQVAGWALGRQARVVSVALEVGNRVREARLGVPRPDLSAAFPGRPWAAEAGFHAWVPVDLGADRAIRVVAELADGSHVSLAVIHIQTPDGG